MVEVISGTKLVVQQITKRVLEPLNRKEEIAPLVIEGLRKGQRSLLELVATVDEGVIARSETGSVEEADVERRMDEDGIDNEEEEDEDNDNED